MKNKNQKQKKDNRKQSTALQTHKGKIEITRSGMGYVTVEAMQRDVLVRPQHFNMALHGDTVEVEIIKQGGAKPEGIISKVVDRNPTEFIGTIQVQKQHSFFIPETERPMPDLYIPSGSLKGAVHGDRVVVRLTNWDKQKRIPEGEVIEVLTGESENDLAMRQILMQSGFPLSFSDEALEDAARIPEQITKSELARR